MVGKPSRTAWLGEPSCSHGRTQQEDQAGGLPLRPELHGPSRSALFSRMPRCYSGQFHTHSSLGCLKSPLGVKEDLTRGTQSTFSYSFSPKRLQFSPDQALRLSFAPRDTSTDRLQGTRLTHRRGQAVQKRSLCAPPPPVLLPCSSHHRWAQRLQPALLRARAAIHLMTGGTAPATLLDLMPALLPLGRSHSPASFPSAWLALGIDAHHESLAPLLPLGWPFYQQISFMLAKSSPTTIPDRVLLRSRCTKCLLAPTTERGKV